MTDDACGCEPPCPSLDLCPGAAHEPVTLMAERLQAAYRAKREAYRAGLPPPVAVPPEQVY